MKLFGMKFSFKELGGAYLVANAPGYLFTAFRSSETISRMTGDLTPEQLAKIYSEYSQKEAKTLKDITIAYSALIAMTFLPHETFQRCAGEVDFDSLRWSKDLLSIFRRQITSVAESRFNLTNPTIISQANIGLARPLGLKLISGGE